MRDCRCGHPADAHVTGMCLHTPDCICPGYEEEQPETHGGEEYEERHDD